MEAQRITRPLEATGVRRQASLPSTMVRADQIEKKFAEDVGVFDLNFEVPTGTIFGMIGPSGCGKTTTVRLMTGLYKPDRGNLTVMNRVPGEPLFTQDLNCHCFDPNTSFVLNPKAWVNPPAGLSYIYLYQFVQKSVEHP